MTEKHIIGVDLGGTNIRVGKVKSNNIVDVYSQLISSNEPEKKVIDEIITSIYETFDNYVIGIGVGVPSIVDVRKGIVYDVQNIPSFKEVHLKKILEDEFKVPVYINNDANCFAVGEKYFGAAKDYNNIIGLTIGTGLGAGIYTDGRLYLGANCGAGEFGMLPYKESIYEDYCSGKYFVNKLKTSGKETFDKAENGDRKAIKIFDDFGTHVGNAISAIMLAVDPELIVIGGSVSIAYKYFKDSIKKVLDNFPYQNSIKQLKIVKSELEQVSILGAAALYFENEDNIFKETEAL
ncbi:MAG: ROK family protein [Ignavibacteriaceae bacterium]